MKNPNRISDSEWNVMRVIWDRPEITASEITPLLNTSPQLSQKTINTFLARLESKGVLRSEKIGRLKHYTASVSESECQRSESQFFLKKVFKGKVGPALLHFVENEELSADEISKLRELINNPSKKANDE